jgi:L-lactate permease
MATWIISHGSWLLSLAAVLISLLIVNAILRRWETQEWDKHRTDANFVPNNKSTKDLETGIKV